MRKREQSDQGSSSESEPAKRKSRFRKTQEYSDDQKVPERTRSKHKLTYNHHPQQDAQNKVPKKEPKIEKKYMAATKEQEKKIKEMKDEIPMQIKDQEPRRLGHRTGQIPLRMTKYNSLKNQNNLKILEETDHDAEALVNLMVKAYQLDRQAYKKGKIACQRIRCFEVIKEKIRNLYLKRKFIEKGGLEKCCLWLIPMKDKKGQLMQPCIGVKMGLLRIIHDLGLESYQINEYASGLWQILKKNRKITKIPQLKNICGQILTAWDYTLFKKTANNLNQ